MYWSKAEAVYSDSRLDRRDGIDVEPAVLGITLPLFPVLVPEEEGEDLTSNKSSRERG